MRRPNSQQLWNLSMMVSTPTQLEKQGGQRVSLKKESGAMGARLEPQARAQQPPRPSLGPAPLALPPPLHGLTQGLQQPLLVVADVVMRQAEQLVRILLAVGHLRVVVGGVG